MARKETSSDKIKQLLLQFGGTEQEWRRLSKEKNVDGLWERAFENAKLGKKVVVTENADGTFELTPQETIKPVFAKVAPAPNAPLDEKLSASMSGILAHAYKGRPEQWQLKFHDAQTRRAYFVPDTALPAWAGVYVVVTYDLETGTLSPKMLRADPPEKAAHLDAVHTEWLQRKADAKVRSDLEHAEWKKRQAKEEGQRKARYERASRELLSTPPVETDAEKNKAADAIIKRVLECDDISEKTLKKAGKALANRFGFGIGLCDENGFHDSGSQIMLSIAPLDEAGYDQHVGSYIEHLLPEGMSEICEASFSYSGTMTLMEVAEDMMKRGFAPDAELQDYLDEVQDKPLWKDLKALFDKVRGDVPPASGVKPSGPGIPKP